MFAAWSPLRHRVLFRGFLGGFPEGSEETFAHTAGYFFWFSSVGFLASLRSGLYPSPRHQTRRGTQGAAELLQLQSRTDTKDRSKRKVSGSRVAKFKGATRTRWETGDSQSGALAFLASVPRLAGAARRPQCKCFKRNARDEVAVICGPP